MSKEDGLKKRLMEVLEERVDGMLEKIDVEEALNLTEIEDMALAVRNEIGEEVSQALVETQIGPEVPGPVCPSCGEEMHYKGQKKKRVQGRSGEVVIERAYYYCETCQEGIFPPR